MRENAKSSPSRPGLYSPAFWRVSAAHFLLGLGFWTFTLFPLHLASLGATRAWLGVLIALEPVASVVIRPWVGGWLSHYGRVRVFRVAGVVHSVGVALYLVAADLGPLLVLARVVHGLGIGALFAAYFTYAADIVPDDRRTEGLAIFGVSGMLPSAIAPLLGEELVLRAGFQSLFAAAVALSLLSLAVSWRLSEPEHEPEGENMGESTGSFLGLAVDRRLMPIWATTLAFSFGASAYFAFLAPYAHDRGLPRVGLFFTCYSVVAVALRLFASHLPDRLGPRRMLVPAMLSLSAGLFVLADLDSMTGLAVAGALCGAGHGYLFPILSGLAVAGIRARERGHAMSLFTALFDSGQMIGPLGLGVVAERLGDPAIFLVGGGVAGAAFVGWSGALLGRARSR